MRDIGVQGGMEEGRILRGERLGWIAEILLPGSRMNFLTIRA